MKKTLYIPIDTTIYDTVECPKLVKRGDTLRLQIKVFTDGVLRNLTGQNIDIILQKSDGTFVENTIDIANISNGVVTANLDVQATVVAGLVSGELQLSDESGQESTNTFTFEVNSSLADGVIEVSKDDINTLNQLRDLIATGETTIAEYETHILAIANSIEAVEALGNIKSYIDVNLAALQQENAEAVVNIPALKTENDKAPALTSNLQTQNDEATANISTLTSKNAEAVNNNNNLDDSISLAQTTKLALDTSKDDADASKIALDSSVVDANASKLAIDTSKAEADASKVAIDLSVQEANDFVAAHGDIIDLDNRMDLAENSIVSINADLSEKANFDTNNGIAVSRIARIINNGSSSGYSNPQGFAFDGTNYYCAYRVYNGTGTDESTKIVKYDTSFNVIASVTANYGHGNSICIYNGSLYICDTNNKVYKLNASDLSYITTYTIPNSVTAIACKDGAFYLLGDAIYKTTDFATYQSISYTLPNDVGVSQGIETDGTYIYMLRTSPNIILQYDMLGDLKYIFKIPLFSDLVFKIGEVEDISISNGKIYFNAVILDETNTREINSIFYTDLVNNIPSLTHQNFMQLNKSDESFTIYVDPSNADKNPLGSFSNPFPTLFEALAMLQSPFLGNCRIIVKSGVSAISENVSFTGIFNKVVLSFTTQCTVGNLIFGRCDVSIMNCVANNIELYYVGQALLNCGYSQLTAVGSNVRLYGGLLVATNPISLFTSTLEGVEGLSNVTVNDYGCHGVFKINTTLNIGGTFTSTLVSKAKHIIVSIVNNGKIFTSIISKTGLNQLTSANIYDGSAGVTFSAYHVTRSGDVLTFNDVRNITLASVAATISTSDSNYYINGLTFVL